MDSELLDKLLRLKELDIEYSCLRDELSDWLGNSCDNYLAGWLRAQLEKGEAFTLNALKASLERPIYREVSDKNIALWHQINEVKKLIAVYELRANQVAVRAASSAGEVA